MKKLGVLAVISLVVFLSLGCDLFGSDDKDSSPVSPFDRILYRLADFAPDYSEEFTATNSIWMRLREGLDHRDVTAVRITDPDGRYWDWEASRLADNWVESSREFRLLNHWARTAPDAVESGGWNLLVTYKGGEFNMPFTVRSISDEGGTGSTLHSDASPEGPSRILGGATDITSVEVNASGTLSFGFNVTDSAVQLVYAWLYAGDGSYLGTSPATTSGITDATTYSEDVSDHPDVADIAQVRILTLARREETAALHEMWLNASELFDVANTYGGGSGSVLSGSASSAPLMIIPDSASDFVRTPLHEPSR